MSDLSVISRDDYDSAVMNGRSFIIIAGIVYDVQSLLAVHPGGSEILHQHRGKDVTKSFNGGVYCRMCSFFQ
jgi:cytochrome b involved in lipid metabolism